MKKIFFITLCIVSIATVAHADKNLAKTLSNKINLKLRHLIENFEGEYLGNTSVDEVNEFDDGSLEIRGKVNYEGNLCGKVRAIYKITIFENGKDKVCILTPICSIFGGQMRKEWDCSGKAWGKWQATTRQIMQAVEKYKKYNN